ncbi:hypothetical protein, partial [Martelella alba]|uniref:hypothetical protein n=1 Tax=Martelella alba TaxID=2590451 RepID=UPI001AEDA1E6
EHCETHSFSSDAYQFATTPIVGNVGRRQRLQLNPTQIALADPGLARRRIVAGRMPTLNGGMRLVVTMPGGT